MAIAPARLRDLPALVALQRRAFPPGLAYTFSTLLFLWALPWVRLLVARRYGEIVGCVIGDRVLDGGRVINLAVAPGARRQGIGARLLEAVEREFPGGDMTLMVQAENTPARALYRHAGYVEDSESANYYGPGRPGVAMRKRRGGEEEEGGAGTPSGPPPPEGESRSGGEGERDGQERDWPHQERQPSASVPSPPPPPSPSDQSATP